ncbi:LytR/AlgR family response regulator transcription factor [Pedobacter cryoconitis]|uniref:Two-component system LytT family response regulator n=1 Tax=Pedobacter cryoconitis TaxID=188932 RepID=A0A7X0MHJ6_9SPHI|nr:LytTR family DNA-binding domain-containing protein [Pedobacter cryoconitis]MBB6499204.1 two-component system LytT family response regulator [Pedobacter cryoconitis]
MNKCWNTLIIDDEELARQRLKRLLTPYECINIVGEAANGAEGLEQIERLNPDLIFLDIEMPVLNGFEMLGRLGKPPKVIFTTAYDQYAVKAFEEESVDYLLKPVEDERLAKAVNRLQSLQPGTDHPIPLDLLLKQLQVKKEIKTLTVKIGDRILLVKIQDLLYIEAEEKYVFLNTVDGKRNLTDFTITSLAEKLPDQFVRINRGTIINSELIKEIRRGFNGAFFFIMNDFKETKLNSSRSYNAVLKDIFDI